MAQVAIAWSLSKDVVSAPIIGTTNLKNLEDSIGKPEQLHLPPIYQPGFTIWFLRCLERSINRGGD